MRIVKNNRLYEDYFDKVNVEDNPEEQVSGVDDNIDDVFRKETRQFAHSLNFVFVFHQNKFIEKLYDNLTDAVKRLEYVFDMNRFFERYAIRGLVLNPEHKMFKQSTFPAHDYQDEENRVLDGNLQVSDPRPLLQSYVDKVKESESKEDTVFEIELLFDVNGDTTDPKYVAPLVVSLFSLGTPVAKVIRNCVHSFSRNDLSMALYIDGVTYRNRSIHYARYYNDIEKAYYQIMRSEKNADKDADWFIKTFIEKLQQRGLDSMDISSDILDTMPKKVVEYIKPTHVTVKFRDDDGQKVQIIFPKNSTLTLNQLVIVWYYVTKYCADPKNNKEKYVPEIYVKCPLKIGKGNYIGKYGNWEDAIKECPLVIADRLKYTKILEFLRYVYVDKFVVNNPLNHQGKDESIYGVVFDIKQFKNPNVEITSPTHNISIRSVRESPNMRTYNAAKKK